MWGWTPPAPDTASGYCGSVSIQSTALYYGNWFTSDAIRGTSGGHDGDHMLLISEESDLDNPNTSVTHACGSLKLNCSNWNYNDQPTPQHTDFLVWSKAAIDAGWPVIIGVYWVIGSDRAYDHIVPMIGYNDTDEGVVYLNDLHGNETKVYAVPDFVSSRKNCKTDAKGLVYEWCLPTRVDYGTVVYGNMDADGELLPTQLVMSSWSEPDYSTEDELEETPIPLFAVVRVTGLEAGSSYVLLRYTSPDDVPNQAFLSNGGFAETIEFIADSEVFIYNVTFMSNSTTLFRCVANVN